MKYWYNEAQRKLSRSNSHDEISNVNYREKEEKEAEKKEEQEDK